MKHVKQVTFEAELTVKVGRRAHARKRSLIAELVAIGVVALSGVSGACSRKPQDGPGSMLPGGNGGNTAGSISVAAGTGAGSNGALGGAGGSAAPAGGTGLGGTGGSGGTSGAGGTGGAGGQAGEAGDPDGGTAGESGAGGAPAEACTGKPGAQRGKSRQTVMAGGLERWFNYYAPSSLDPNTPTALVIVPHGYFMDADIMYEVTQYAELADQEQFVVAFPSGAGSTILDDPWNIGTPNPTCIATVGFLPMTQNDDQAFLDEIISFVEADQCIDPNHIFMTGFSMGAYFTNTTGCNRDEIKAIAPHSGGSHDFANCPVEHKPVLLMHFEGDALIPYTCGTDTRDRWLELNGCQSADPRAIASNLL